MDENDKNMGVNVLLAERDVLKSIRMHNFKSYRGEFTIEGINPKLSVIIGPNGSGKSNIIDAILFVLGYRAKKMRHASLKDLINKAEKECSVELSFSTFGLKREINVSGASKYYIN